MASKNAEIQKKLKIILRQLSGKINDDDEIVEEVLNMVMGV